MQTLQIVALIVNLAAGAGPARTWTDSTGTFSVEAELATVQQGKVQLRKTDGSTVTVPVAQLSEPDRRYLASLKAPDGDAATPAARPENDAGQPSTSKTPRGSEKGRASLRAGPAALATALSRPTNAAFAHTPLADAIESLKDQHHVEIQIDRKGLADIGIRPDTPITFTSGKRETLQSALEKMFEATKLQWLLHNEVILITTPERADRWQETRVNKVLRGSDADAMIRQITSQIAPRSWDSVGGPGAVAPWLPPGGLLAVVITQTQKTHRLLEQSFAGVLRRIDPSEARPTRRKGRPVAGPAARLSRPVECDFGNTPLREVAADLSAKQMLRIRLDEYALKAIGLTPETPVTLHVRGISLRSVLSLITENFGSAWVVTRDGVDITSPKVAETNLTSALYDVHDLVPILRAPGIRDPDMLVQIVSSTIAPTTWKTVGGPGTIVASQGGAVLQVTQNCRVHEEIEHVLLALRLASRP